MSERRRRKLDDEGEDGESETAKKEITRPRSRSSEYESEDETQEADFSEYESAADENGEIEVDESMSETESGTGSESDEESETETDGGFTDEEGLQEERQSGDGEEQPEGKPDDDEDKKNPAYVPRKGAFYEHDYRQGDEGPGDESQEQMMPKKKLWQDEGKWGHDRYFDEMQAPKTREELISLYGYDIQAADKPPDMPPRKMGRGRGIRGPKRMNQVQDFMPRMAIIDTTDYGKDSVPNFDENAFDYRYEGRHNEKRRFSGRAGSRGRGRGNYDKDQSEDRKALYNYGGSLQDARSQDYPSLDEISRQTKMFEDFRNDKKMSYSHRDEKESGSQESYTKENMNDSNIFNKKVEGDRRSFQYVHRGSGDVRNQTYDNSNYRNNNRGNFNKSSRQSEFQKSDSRCYDSNTRCGFNDSAQKNTRQESGDFKGKEDRARYRECYEDNNNLYGNINDRGDGNLKSSKNVVFSNKENVQTINVTITSTTTEKKSYAKERRGKGATKTEESIGQMTSIDQRTMKSSASQNESLGSSATPSRRYSSQRQQNTSKGNFSGPPALDGSKFYNPALPPPSFYQHESSSVRAPHSPIATSAPKLLPSASTLPFGMPVSGAALPSPATAPPIFQSQRGPPPPSAATLITPPFLPAGMVYGGGARVPPPGTPAAFPVPLAYTSPPPTTAAGVQPPTSSNPPRKSSSPTKKVYRGDIIYYAPELQQPSRTPQKRPKAAIPIVNPQEIRLQKSKGYDDGNDLELKKELEYVNYEEQVPQEQVEIENLTEKVDSVSLVSNEVSEDEVRKGPKHVFMDAVFQEQTEDSKQIICDKESAMLKEEDISAFEIKENNYDSVENAEQVID